MKFIRQYRILLVVLAFMVTACGARFKGSASDRSGTNGATNGTGKISKTL